MVFLLGLTGNIACGKSTVGQLLLARYGADYVDADRVVHSLYAAHTPETAAIAARFGADLLEGDGKIDRRRLGDIVMADKTALADLEAILNPSVRRAIEARIAASTSEVVVLDAIRLIEAGLAARCDTVWVVVCDRAAQLARLQASRSMTPEQAALRIDAQRPIEEKIAHANAVLTNDGTPDDLANEIAAAWETTVWPTLAHGSRPA